MALFHPADPPEDCSPAERRVRKEMARSLPDSWHIFHQVAWQAPRDGREGDGEADFVLLHPEVGLLVLEVKGGGIDIVQGRWHSTDRHGDTHGIKDPFAQARDSKHALYRYLNQHMARGAVPDAGHAVALPDISLLPPSGPDAPPEITWLSPDLLDLEGALKRTVGHWKLQARMPQDRVQRITDLLAPTVTARSLLRDRVAETRRALLDLTARQVRTLQQLRRNRRAVIYGPAGTGKSVLARERARRMAEEGFRVLLTCFNRPLAEHLGADFPAEGGCLAANFHALGEHLGVVYPEEPSNEWWVATYPTLLVDAAAEADFAVDAIVVDEGQDFEPAWFEALALLAGHPDAPFYVFADPCQNIYREAWKPPFEGASFDLFDNCRSTRPLACFSSALVGAEPPEGGPPGPEPDLVQAGDDPGPTVGKVLNRLLQTERLPPESVSVLCDRRSTLERLRESRPGGHVLVKPGEEGLVSETIHRFKGLESDAVVMCLTRFQGDRDRALAYIGASRARSVLCVVAGEEVLQQIRRLTDPPG